LNAFPHETAEVSDDQVDLEHPFSIRFAGVLQGNIQDLFGYGQFMHAGLKIAERREHSAKRKEMPVKTSVRNTLEFDTAGPAHAKILTEPLIRSRIFWVAHPHGACMGLRAQPKVKVFTSHGDQVTRGAPSVVSRAMLKIIPGVIW